MPPSHRPIHTLPFTPAHSHYPLYTGPNTPPASHRSTPSPSHHPLHTIPFTPAPSHHPLHTGPFTPSPSHHPLHTIPFTPQACESGPISYYDAQRGPNLWDYYFEQPGTWRPGDSVARSPPRVGGRGGEAGAAWLPVRSVQVRER
eukprot:scaffold23675_cov129-Isochrysis_galbana.AAC.1